MPAKLHHAFRPLSENLGLVFAGARLSPRLIISERAAKQLGAERDAECVRPFVDRADWKRDSSDRFANWVIDFAPGMRPEEARATGAAWTKFSAAGGRLQKTASAQALRIALAKTDRVLASPSGRKSLHWRWLDARVLPGSGLVVIARDDAFLAAVLRSLWFAIWLWGHEAKLSAAAVAAFPFPWAPQKLRSALSRDEEEKRGAVVRAEEGADQDAAVALAYGWPEDISAEAAWTRLNALAATRAG